MQKCTQWATNTIARSQSVRYVTRRANAYILLIPCHGSGGHEKDKSTVYSFCCAAISSVQSEGERGRRMTTMSNTIIGLLTEKGENRKTSRGVRLKVWVHSRLAWARTAVGGENEESGVSRRVRMLLRLILFLTCAWGSGAWNKISCEHRRCIVVAKGGLETWENIERRARQEK